MLKKTHLGYYITMNYKQQITQLLNEEEIRQCNTISLIASENIASKAVRRALSSVLTNKYAEGYPAKRYYSGCCVADEIETLTIDLAKKIFNAQWANVQPHSGSQANAAVFFALLEKGDTILSLSLEAGGHLTHGAKVSSTARFYNVINYGLNDQGLINIEQLEILAKKHKPKMIIAGASSYPGLWPWKKIQQIASENNAYLLADIAHIAGLIAGGVDENPIDYAHVLTATTHKTLRGPRGGVILSNNKDIGAKIDKAIFPATQGGPIMNAIAAKAVGFAENLDPEFKTYAKNTLTNAKILANELKNHGGKLLTNDTKNHLMILDTRSFDFSAKELENFLQEANILLSTCTLPDETSWKNPNGVRLGTPYITTLGINDITEFAKIFTNALSTKNNAKLKKYVQQTANDLYKKFL